jgi:ADP-ribosyl-[dinitrogen reductase] hydrolase
MTRTSHSHPLRIDTIKVGCGKLGLSFCPGKVQAESQTGGWDRDLNVDLDAIRAWGAGTVLTLLEREEMAALKVPELGQATKAHAMDWVHLPLPNDSVPDAAWMEKFLAIQPDLNARIARGEGIFIHCMGGIGRTSVAAALLLLHAGWSAERSIGAVRQARANSFVMPEQAEFVRIYERTLSRHAAPRPRPF